MIQLLSFLIIKWHLLVFFISIKWSNGGNWDNLTRVSLIELSFGTGCINYLKGDSNPNDKYVYQKVLFESWILIQVSSKSVEKWGSNGYVNDSFEYNLISFQNFFNCLNFNCQYYHIICVSADMQLYIHKENVILKINANNHLACILFWLRTLIRLCDITKPTIWPLTLKSTCKYSNAQNFHVFQPI